MIKNKYDPIEDEIELLKYLQSYRGQRWSYLGTGKMRRIISIKRKIEMLQRREIGV